MRKYLAVLVLMVTTPVGAVDLYYNPTYLNTGKNSILYSTFRMAQSLPMVTTAEPFQITDFSIGLYKDANVPAGTYKVTLQGDNGGSPDGNTIFTLQNGSYNSITKTTSSATAGYTGITQTYADGPTLQPNTRYWVVAQTTGLPNTVNGLAVLMSKVDTTVADSSQKLYIPLAWYDKTGDLSMIVRGQPIAAVVAVPEPSTYAMAALSMCVLAYRHKRAKKCVS